MVNVFGSKDPCSACNGSGKVDIPENAGTYQICKGEGKVMELPVLEPRLCENCHGQGIAEIPSIVEINNRNENNRPHFIIFVPLIDVIS